MARLFATSINLNKNELQNARIQNLSANPSSPVAGQIYFNTVENELRYYDGNQWVSGSSVEFGDTDSRPVASKAGQLYVDTEAKVVYVDNGTAWIQGTLSTDDVNGLISDHSDLSNGVHGLGESDGNIVGTKKTQTFENKTIGDNLHFNDGTAAGYITGDTGNLIIHGNNEVEIIANTNIQLTTDSGNIVLNPDGNAYIGNDGSSNNRIATIGDLNSSEVVQSVSGTLGEVEVNTDVNGDVTVGLPNTVSIRQELNVGGNNLGSGYLYVRRSDSSYGLAVEPSADRVIVSGELKLENSNGEHKLTIGDAYSTDTTITAVNDLEISSNSGDITLSPDGTTYVQSQLNVNGNTNTPTVAGYALNGADGTLRLQDGNGDSQIHINGVTKNIEILPLSGSKAFYGSSATAGNEIAKISDLQALSSGLNWKQAVNLLADSDIPLNIDILAVPSPIDGHELSGSDLGYRILAIGQENPAENGIYELVLGEPIDGNTRYKFVRTEDADAHSELIGAALFVMEGTQYGATSWVQSNHYITDFTNQEWVQFSGQGTYIGSNSIVIDGNEINAVVDTTRGLAIDGDGIHATLSKGLSFDGTNGAIRINAGPGFDLGSGSLEFASGYGVRKFTATIGDNSETSFNLDHNFNTRHVTVQIFEASSPYAQIEADVEHSTLNRVVVRFASAPTTGQYEVVVVG